MNDSVDDVMDGDLTPDFLDKQEEELFEEYTIGHEVIVFLNSTAGRRLRATAIRSRMDAERKLIRTPHWRKRKCEALRRQALMADQFLSWLHDMVVQGEEAGKAITYAREEMK
jgi:hypothetical protein